MNRSLAASDWGRDKQLPAILSVLNIVCCVRVRLMPEARRPRVPASSSHGPRNATTNDACG